MDKDTINKKYNDWCEANGQVLAAAVFATAKLKDPVVHLRCRPWPNPMNRIDRADADGDHLRCQCDRPGLGETQCSRTARIVGPSRCRARPRTSPEASRPVAFAK
jgi:hypothetical protein